MAMLCKGKLSRENTSTRHDSIVTSEARARHVKVSGDRERSSDGGWLAGWLAFGVIRSNFNVYSRASP